MSYLFHKEGLVRITKKDIEEKTDIVLTKSEENTFFEACPVYDVRRKEDDEDAVWGCFEFEKDGDDEVLTEAGYHSPICYFLRILCDTFAGVSFIEGDEVWDDTLSDKCCQDLKKGKLKFTKEEEKAFNYLYTVGHELRHGIWSEEGNPAKRAFIEDAGRDAFVSVNEKIKGYYADSEIYSRIVNMMLRDDLDDTKII